MTQYIAPIKDMRFVLNEVVGLGPLVETGHYPDLGSELVDTVLEEAGKLAQNVIGPLNHSGDKEGSKLENGAVRTPAGFADAYRLFVEGGWTGVPFEPEWGGQGLPWTVAIAVQELWHASNMSFGLCPMLTQGAIEALTAHGTEEQKQTYLTKLIEGVWTGTMNLTEPQAGSDVGALRTKAIRMEDGTYRITGTKIFITFGDHDLAENIIHLVLARLPDAPVGTRGISLFLVPKFLVNADGSLGARNDVKCVGLEHKLGIHASPTCVMSFGENGGAVGYLIGTENRGMACMFTMMNNARLSVGLQGVGIAERAFQAALAYAKDRKQGKPFGLQHELRDMLPIISHPDVRRMLMTMKASTEAMRAMCYLNAQMIDLARSAADGTLRETAKARAELFTPVTKAWCTDMGVEIASIGVQIHGGMGFVEETGAAQHFRDARIAPIYEGTNGIQAIDLVTRKIGLDNGAVVRTLFAEITDTVRTLDRTSGEAFAIQARHLSDGLKSLETATNWLLERIKSKPYDALAGATPYLKLFGTVLGGWLLAKGALAARKGIEQGASDPEFLKAKISTAKFYAESILPTAAGLVIPATSGVDSLYEIEPELLAG